MKTRVVRIAAGAKIPPNAVRFYDFGVYDVGVALAGAEGWASIYPDVDINNITTYYGWSESGMLNAIISNTGLQTTRLGGIAVEVVLADPSYGEIAP